MIVDTTDEHGNPHCPICNKDVGQVGVFCSPECWQHFHTVVFEMGEPVEMDYLGIYEQPWYGDDDG
jgi:hypothetical protein